MRLCGSSSPEGPLWVDPGLRPEGRSGALVRTLDSHLGYYERWAQTWSSRPCSRPGRRPAMPRWAPSTSLPPDPWCGRRPDGDNFVEDVQAMRRRVEQSVSTKSAERQLKLGQGRTARRRVQCATAADGAWQVRPGGTQWRHDESSGGTRELRLRGSQGRRRAGVRPTSSCGRWNTGFQLYRLQRTHVVPEGERDLRRVARSLGFRSDPVGSSTHAGGTPAARSDGCTKLFYRPLLQAVARLEPGEARLTPGRPERLVALGFTDPASALRHLEALTSGSRAERPSTHPAASAAAVLVRRQPGPGRGVAGVPSGSATLSAPLPGICDCCATSRRRLVAWRPSWDRAGTPASC